MKKLLSLLLACVLLCGCAQTNTPTDVTTTTPDNVAEESDNRFESYDFSAYAEEIKYNENVDISSGTDEKPNADGSVMTEKRYEEILKDAYGVAIIKVTEDDESLFYSMAGDNKELEQAMIDKYGKVDVVEVKVKKAEVLYSIGGSHNVGDKISVSGSDLEIGKEYLIVTKEYVEDEKTYYPALDGKTSVFNISEDFSVTARSTQSVSAKYNGLSLADVAHDLKTKFDNAKTE